MNLRDANILIKVMKDNVNKFLKAEVGRAAHWALSTPSFKAGLCCARLFTIALLAAHTSVSLSGSKHSNTRFSLHCSSQLALSDKRTSREDVFHPMRRMPRQLACALFCLCSQSPRFK